MGGGGSTKTKQIGQAGRQEVGQTAIQGGVEEVLEKIEKHFGNFFQPDVVDKLISGVKAATFEGLIWQKISENRKALLLLEDFYSYHGNQHHGD